MRQFITVVFLLFSCSNFSSAQAIELCAGGGMAINSNPSTNLKYKGKQLTYNYVGFVNAQYDVNTFLLVGIDLRITELSRKTDSAYIPASTNEKLVYAKSLFSATAVANFKLNVRRSYWYLGPAVGYGMVLHNAANIAWNEQYRAPNNGSGLVLGAQLGVTRGLSEYVGVNFEAAYRRYSLRYNTSAPDVVPTESLAYNINALSVTIGIKVRIIPKHRAYNQIPGQTGKGRSL